MDNITEAARVARRAYRVFLEHNYSRHDARACVLRILFMHGFGPHGYLRRAYL